MSDEISSPLLSLIRENGLIDDLQYEEVAGELKRSGANPIQVLQDFGIMKLDDILHVEATALGNLLVQVRASGEIKSLSEMREVSRASSQVTRYEPARLPG